jgi:hypothetical protein
MSLPQGKRKKAPVAFRKVPAATGPDSACLDSYCLDRNSRVVLVQSRVPGAVVDRLGLSINGYVLPIPLDAGIMLGFGPCWSASRS